MLDNDGQPINKFFNRSRNRVKCIFTLKGLLNGVVADNKLNDMEVMFLDLWIKEHKNLPMEGDVLDLSELIGDILEDGIVTAEELGDLKSLISCIIEYGTNSSKDIENSINELNGLLLGISADGKLVDQEFEYLDSWLMNNHQLHNQWPAIVLIERIKLIKADGIVDEIEKRDLLKIICQISGQEFQDTGSAEEAVIDVFTDIDTDFKHLDKKICFTGKFYLGKRKMCEEKAKENGAIISKKVTKELDVLVVGTGNSIDWRFQNFGRKIQKAIEYRKNGQEILILSEEKWLQCLI